MIDTRLKINNQDIDIEGVIDFPLTFSISDVKNPNKRKRNSSKTIKLPGTKNNNKFFQAAWDLRITDVRGDSLGFDFDPTIKYPATVTRNGAEIFRGTANLQKIVQKDNVNTFHLVLYSQITNLIQELGDKTVAELGWSEYDHVLSTAEQIASWSRPTGSDVWWPLIDYGYTDDQLTYKTNQLRPYVYVKEILEKCFESVGWTMSSAHFDNALFKKITWGYGGGEQIQLSSSDVNNRRAKWTGDGSQTNTFPFSSYSPISDKTKFNNSDVIPFADNSVVNMSIVQDNQAQFDDSTGEFVIFNDGDYKLDIVADVDLTYDFSNPAVTGQAFEIVSIVRMYKNGAIINQKTEVDYYTSGGSSTVSFNFSQDVQANAGDVLSVEFRYLIKASFDGFDASVTLDYDIDFDNSISLDLQAINIELIDGDTVEIARFLPKMKAKDLIEDVITLFNMYMSDPDDENVVVFEPIEAFYFSSDDTDDWSGKIDKSKPIEISPASNIQGKVYSFKFATDRDYYKQRYFDIYGVDYGDYDYNVPSTFKTGEKKYTLKIAQSCPVQIEGSDIIIPRIIKVDESTLVTSPHNGKPRIFFNNGLKTGDWDLVNSDTGAVTSLSSYPQAHHLNSLISPTYDLNFGVPQYVFYNATAYTSNNCFQAHHLQFIRELTGRDSKLVNAFFKLNESDLYNNFMRRLVNIDGVVYRKNIVKDMRATTNDTTKVELVKIVEGKTRKTYNVINTYEMAQSKMSYGGDPNTPISEDINAKSGQIAYNIDTSSKDVVVTVDPDTLLQGWQGEFKKLDSSNDLTIQVPKLSTSTIDGEANITLKEKYDSVSLYFDGVNFKIVSAVGSVGNDHHSGFNRINGGKIVVIKEDKQMINYDGLTIAGDLEINGDLILK